jgi:hypothetical protein
LHVNRSTRDDSAPIARRKSGLSHAQNFRDPYNVLNISMRFLEGSLMLQEVSGFLLSFVGIPVSPVRSGLLLSLRDSDSRDSMVHQSWRLARFSRSDNNLLESAHRSL